METNLISKIQACKFRIDKKRSDQQKVTKLANSFIETHIDRILEEIEDNSDLGDGNLCLVNFDKLSYDLPEDMPNRHAVLSAIVRQMEYLLKNVFEISQYCSDEDCCKIELKLST